MGITPQFYVALAGLILAVTTSIVSIAVYTGRTRAMADANAIDIKAVSHTTKNIENWRLNILPKDLSDNYARKGEMAAELRSINDSLKRIENHQAMMAQRIMNGGAGAP